MSLQNEWTQRIAELEAKLTDVELRCVKICGQRDELLAASEPFAKLAVELLSVDSRHRRNDDTPVFACNNAQITIGDCKAIAKARGQV